MRQPRQEDVEMAWNTLVFCDNAETAARTGYPVVETLTSDAELSQTFPAGHLYELCSRYDISGKIAVVVDCEESQMRAIREAALGFRDNPACQ